MASHSVGPSSLTGALSETSPVRRLLISITSRSGTASSCATASATSCVSPVLSPPNLCMARRKPKNSFRCAAVGLKMRRRDDKPEIGFADQIGKRKVVSLVAPRDLCRQPQMTGDERIGRATVAVFLPAPCELLLAHRLEQSVSLDQGSVFIGQRVRSALAQHLAAV